MSLYSEAVHAIVQQRETRQQTLDDAATEARRANLEAQRRAILEWESEDSAWRPVIVLASETFTIGRDDGYPNMSFPPATQNALGAAICAGMKQHALYDDGSGLRASPDGDAWECDYKAWKAAGDYRSKQAKVPEL